ncbi:calcium-binding protein [Neotabrizicola shimadae]|uniref:Calcium-binding protein n=1 Tax=Neotabrizicola shimadae TaxID=2807096 RepID=A0A8G0ZRX7_9RHOB|nr:calcium-binding protein [Neotabrizicola shimadae]QYZ68897.1 hypothetical protein JO391_14185 [Neotabrizicola shimadae]
MIGGAGDDIYGVTSAADMVFETKSIASALDAGGQDEVQSSVSFSLDAHAGVRFVERLTLTGTGNTGATGNALANVLTGNAGSNTLVGGAGADTMIGGAGDDIYGVTSSADQVHETTTITSALDAGGRDEVQSSVAFNLDAYLGVRFVENLVLTGTGNIAGIGNALANRITGNAANNVINGGLGADTLTGGFGNDAFVFSAALGGGNIDRITDFSAVDDTIRLDDLVFSGMATGALAASGFVSNLTGNATDVLHRVIYETDTGRLFFDADGNGSGARVQFATLSAGLTLTAADFFVV